MSGEIQVPDIFPPRVISCYPVNTNGRCALDKILSPCAQSTPISSRISVNHFNHLGNGVIFLPWHNSPQWDKAFSLSRIHDHSRHTTLGRTPLYELSARRRDLYLTTHNTHNRQTSMPQGGFEPAIPASKRPQIHALDRAAIGIDEGSNRNENNSNDSRE